MHMKPSSGEMKGRWNVSEASALRSRRILSLAIIMIAITIAAVYLYRDYEAKGQKASIVRAGDDLPTITLKNLAGESTTVQEMNASSPMLINFWASWCKPCINELPLLNEAQAFAPEVTFVAINMKEGLDKIEPLIERYDLTMMVLRDEHLSWKKVLAMQGYPVTILVNGDGVIQHIHTGAYTSIEEIIGQASMLTPSS